MERIMKHKILVVEDNDDNRLLVSRILRHHGYEVVEAADGEEGMMKAKVEKPDIIMIDIQMPKLNGFEAIKLLKGDPETGQIKIIALTSFAMPGDKDKVLSAGADEYISKPVDTRELPEIVKRLTESL
jgi:CheY-like chemotaxis protein